MYHSLHQNERDGHQPGDQASNRIIVGRLKVFFRRYEDVVMLAARRYNRIKNFLATAAASPGNPEQRLTWLNKLDDAWLTWRQAWDIYCDVNHVLQEPFLTSIKPPDKPEW